MLQRLIVLFKLFRPEAGALQDTFQHPELLVNFVGADALLGLLARALQESIGFDFVLDTGQRLFARGTETPGRAIFLVLAYVPWVNLLQRQSRKKTEQRPVVFAEVLKASLGYVACPLAAGGVP